MNSNDKITINIKDIEPLKKIDFKENPSYKFLILILIIIFSILMISISTLIISLSIGGKNSR
jgi:hypothetical protein